MGGTYFFSSCGYIGAGLVGAPLRLLASGGASVGQYQALILWPIFWLLACTVPVALAIAVVPPLRRGAALLSQRYPRVGTVLMLAYFSLFSTYLLGAVAISGSSVPMAMLFRGEARLFFRDLLFPGGRLSLPVLALGVLWLGIQAASIWMGWALFAPCPRPHGNVSIRAHRPRWFSPNKNWLHPFLLFTAAAIAIFCYLAVRFYPSQIRAERAMSADQTSLHRLHQARDNAQAKLDEALAGQAQRQRMVSSWTRVAQLAQASGLSAQRLDAAKRERDRRLSRLVYASSILATLWLTFGARRIGSLLRTFGGYQGMRRPDEL